MAFPKGSKFVEMVFTDLFEQVESDSKFGGIFINRSSELMYLIPREMFPDVRKVVGDK